MPSDGIARRLDKKEFEALCQRLWVIAAAVTSEQLSELKDGIVVTVQGVPGVVRPNIDWDLDELALELAKHGAFASRYTASYLQDKLMEPVAAYQVSRESGEAALNLLLKELYAFTIEQTVYLPVLGLDMEIASFTIGAVTFRVLDEVAIQEFSERAERLSANWIDDPLGPSGKELVERHRELLELNLLGSVVGEVKVVAETLRAIEIAENEVRRALEVLIFCFVSQFPRYHYAHAAPRLASQALAPPPMMVVTNPQGIVDRMQAHDSTFPITIHEVAIERLGTRGLTYLSALLLPGATVSKMAEAIFNSIHWLSESQTQQDDSARLLSLVTSLECVLNPQGQDVIGKSIARSTALLVSRSPADRTDVFNFVLNLYQKRSGITHGGKKVLDRRDLYRLRGIVVNVLLALIEMRDTVRSYGTLRELLDEVILSGHEVRPARSTTLLGLRRHAGLDQDELATALKTDLTTLVSWEQSDKIGVEGLERYAQYFGLPVENIQLPPSLRFTRIAHQSFVLHGEQDATGDWLAEIHQAQLENRDIAAVIDGFIKSGTGRTRRPNQDRAFGDLIKRISKLLKDSKLVDVTITPSPGDYGVTAPDTATSP